MGYIGLNLGKIPISDFPIIGFPDTILNSIVFSPIIEEMVFFGLPFYLFKNRYLILITGSIWCVIHLFLSAGGSFGYLDTVTFLATIPRLIFSIRIWLSGRGWFSTITHIFQNGLAHFLNCHFGSICKIFSFENEFMSTSFLLMLGLALTLSFIVFVVYAFWDNKMNDRIYKKPPY